jgi:hypothetical protein
MDGSGTYAEEGGEESYKNYLRRVGEREEREEEMVWEGCRGARRERGRNGMRGL